VLAVVALIDKAQSMTRITPAITIACVCPKCSSIQGVLVGSTVRCSECNHDHGLLCEVRKVLRDEARGAAIHKAQKIYVTRPHGCKTQTTAGRA
jgi:hypothetical protein